MRSVAGVGSRLKTKLAAVSVGVTAVVVGVVLVSVQTWTIATDVDCVRPPCYARERPFLGLSVFVMVVGVLVALVVWTSGREQMGPPRKARPPRPAEPSDPQQRRTS